MCWKSFSVVVYSVVLCALFDIGPSRVLAQVSLKANYDYGDAYKIGEYKMKLLLQCSIENSIQGTTYVWKWFKGDNLLSTDSEDPHHIHVSDNTVLINRFVESDAGKYICRLYNSKDTKSELSHKEINVVLKPYLKLPKTATFIEGEKVKLECTVYGVPTPEVIWKFENTKIEASNEIQFSSNEQNISNAALIFNSISMDKRGNYVCSGKTSFLFEDVNSVATYVRIKDKMAALWPFLGICAEVIILCLIIFIYEKKRNKAEFEESDTDQGPETNNANDHSGGDVRHRK